MKSIEYISSSWLTSPYIGESRLAIDELRISRKYVQQISKKKIFVCFED